MNSLILRTSGTILLNGVRNYFNQHDFHAVKTVGMHMRREEVDDELKELAFEFLYFFSRFEYALKANGYLKKEGAGQPAEAGWRKLRDRWEAEYVLTDAAAKLIASPGPSISTTTFF